MEFILSLLELLAMAGKLLAPSDLDVVVDETVLGFRQDAVAEGFDGYDSLRSGLRQWAKEQMPRLVESMTAGEAVTSDDVAASLRTGGLEGLDPQEVERAASAFVLAAKRRVFAGTDAVFLLAQREEALHARTHEMLETLVAGSVVSGRLEGVVAPSASPNTSEPGQPSDRDVVVRINAKIDIARGLLDRGKYQTALQELEDVRQSEGQHLWARAHFRISINLAVAAIALGDTERAAHELEKARVLYPDDPILRANEIQLALFRDDVPEAVRLASEAQDAFPGQSDLRHLIMEAYVADGRPEDALALAADESSLDAGTLVACASAYQATGQLDEAISAVDRALALDAENARIMAMAAALRMMKVRRLAADRGLGHFMSADLQAILKDARSLLKSALEVAEQQEAPQFVIQTKVNLAAAELGVGGFSSAVRLCDEVLAQEPGESAATVNRGEALYKLEQYGRAVADLRDVYEMHPDEVIVPLVISLIRDGKASQGVELLESHWSREMPDALRVDIADLILQFSAAETEESPVIAAALEFLGGVPGRFEAEAQITIARYRLRTGDVEGARRILLGIDFEAAVAAGAHPVSLIDAAYSLLKLGEFDSAVRLAQLITPSTDLEEAWEVYVLGLYNSHQASDALRAAVEYRERCGVHPGVSRVEAGLLHQLGRRREAAELYSAMFDVDSNPVWALNSAACWIQDGDADTARDVMERLGGRTAVLDVGEKMRAAMILNELGMPGALELAYAAARRSPNDPRLQGSYFALFVQVSSRDEEQFLVDEVVLGTAVLLSFEGRSQWRLLVGADEPNPGPLDVSADSQIGRGLLGHKKGDQVIIQTDNGVLTYAVEDIQSKYVRLFQESGSEFEERFPDSGLMRAVHVSEGDLHELHEVLEAQNRQLNQALGLVISKGLPAAGFSRFTGIGVFETVHSLSSDPNVPTRLSDASLLNRSVDLNQPLVLDLTSLVTLQRLGVLGKLQETQMKCVVSQQTLDELHAASTRLQERDSTASMAGDGKNIWLTEAGEHKGLHQAQQALSEILAFVEHSCSARTTTAVLDYADEDDRLVSIVGLPTLSSVLLAKEMGTAAIVDDAGARVIAESKTSGSTSDSVCLLSTLKDAGVIAPEEYRLSLAELIAAGYVRLPLTSNEVLALVEDHRFNPDAATLSIVTAALGNGVITDDGAVALSTDIIVRTCMKMPLELVGGRFVDAVLDGLRRRGPHLVIALMKNLRARLLLAPIMWERVRRWASTWYAARGLELPEE